MKQIILNTLSIFGLLLYLSFECSAQKYTLTVQDEDLKGPVKIVKTIRGPHLLEHTDRESIKHTYVHEPETSIKYYNTLGILQLDERYDKSGKLSHKYRFEYSAKNKLYRKYEYDNNGQLSIKTQYEYTASHRLKRIVEYDSEDNLLKSLVYKYKNNGDEVETQFDGDGALTLTVTTSIQRNNSQSMKVFKTLVSSNDEKFHSISTTISGRQVEEISIGPESFNKRKITYKVTEEGEVEEEREYDSKDKLLTRSIAYTNKDESVCRMEDFDSVNNLTEVRIRERGFDDHKNWNTHSLYKIDPITKKQTLINKMTREITYY